jgi:hypothetical protein
MTTVPKASYPDLEPVDNRGAREAHRTIQNSREKLGAPMVNSILAMTICAKSVDKVESAK